MPAQGMAINTGLLRAPQGSNNTATLHSNQVDGNWEAIRAPFSEFNVFTCTTSRNTSEKEIITACPSTEEHARKIRQHTKHELVFPLNSLGLAVSRYADDGAIAIRGRLKKGRSSSLTREQEAPHWPAPPSPASDPGEIARLDN
ncbi:hypothetical protein E2C01_060797 [Portunus trituberculatus]|uniref:Uncharacterized protein n=1 Tax=Portunus trituberculatus TaxID=210409 RepID=A0A5B7HBJ9_PORTR|nr:hypothetical protein [Portunus trituberculatus]